MSEKNVDLKNNVNNLRNSIHSLWNDVLVVLRYSSHVLKKYKKELATGSILKLLSFPFGLSIIYITRATLDKGLFGKDLTLFVKFTFLGLGCFVATRALGYFSNKVFQHIRALFSLDVNGDLAKRFFGYKYSKIKELSSAENRFMLEYDYYNIEKLVFGDLPTLLSFFKVPVFFILSLMLSVPLTLMVFLAVPFTLLHMVWSCRRKKEIREREVEKSCKYNACIQDMLFNAKLVKSYGKEDWAVGKVQDLFEKSVWENLKMYLFSSKVNFISGIVFKLNTVLFWLVGGYLIISGKLTFGTFSAVAMYTSLMVSEVDNLSNISQSIFTEKASLKRCAEFIEGFPQGQEIANEPAAKERELSGDIIFKNISFGYAEGDLLFEDLSLTAPSRKWTLIRGTSGVGKTSLLNLFIKLFEPLKGDILIGENDVLNIEGKEFFKDIAVVHQDAHVLDDTLLNNILLGEDISEDRLKAILACIKLNELVDGLPMGYNSVVGEEGCTLSGGQRQRVAIARALARDPRILILDEATSSIDSVMEEEIFSNIKKKFPNLTVVFVTHRPNAIKFADEVLTLENGLIVKGDLYGEKIPGKNT